MELIRAVRRFGLSLTKFCGVKRRARKLNFILIDGWDLTVDQSTYRALVERPGGGKHCPTGYFGHMKREYMNGLRPTAPIAGTA
jgi:hypothetical protein